ncbi:4'-phosphopantetheinyl transferase superfamily protein [Granulibacter bethesdensis]|uniref:4'-phosphopantetheinyl transferase family protein n=1 Tax=Granulibacter bethesdensis TaxID=364410 RepID=UPI0012FD0E03|nr:4'-phosphopantetheinyl transferase superfamily protein [Granulibacter bethesdensis]
MKSSFCLSTPWTTSPVTSALFPFSLTNDTMVVATLPVEAALGFPPSWLSQEEMTRRDTYRLPADRNRHQAAHTLKRWLLAGFLNLHPTDLVFDVDANGKPSLTHGNLHFNISHSGQHVVIAVRAGNPVGIDVEERPPSDTILPWSILCHAQDNREGDIDDFLALWTVKEAMAKSSGEGLGLDFTRLSLHQYSDLYMRGCDGLRQWHALHTILDDGAHIAVASVDPWQQTYWLSVSMSDDENKTSMRLTIKKLQPEMAGV